MGGGNPGISGPSASFYDGAYDSGARSSFNYPFPLSAKREINPFVRREILKRLRALEANLGLVQRAKGQVSKYAIGFGVFPGPRTLDPDWNKQSRAQFMDWANNPAVCDVAGAMNFWERQRYHAETFFAENESFDCLVSSSFSGAPQLQLFDNTEVGSPYGYALAYNLDYIDGVKPDQFYKPLSYLVSVESAQPKRGYQFDTREIPAGDMIHIVKRKRANQLRGISPWAPVINAGIDVLDLEAVVNHSAKLHNAMGVSVNKKSGDGGKKGLTAKVQQTLNSEGKVTQVDEKFIRGAAIQYLGLDEEIKIVSSDRPTENLLNFLVYRIRHIINTTGLPFEIVWDMATLGGAASRIILEDAQWFFDLVQDILNDRFNQRVWVWFCASQMKRGLLPVCKDPRWWVCDWQGPPKLTADAGRTAQSEIDLLHSGFNSWQDYYAKRGRNWQPVIQGRIDELKWAKGQCDTAGIPLEYIFAPKPGTVLQVHGGQNGDQP